jgi:hypothetical protein
MESSWKNGSVSLIYFSLGLGCFDLTIAQISHCLDYANLLFGRYKSIRLDIVHYCPLEEILAERRKKRSRFNHNADPEDPATSRLRQLCRTLRDDNTGLGQLVKFVKLPYMTRETNKATLARMLAVLPNLLYVDLPDGFYNGDTHSATLRGEVEARCGQLRKMTFAMGSERNMERAVRAWRKIEVLELKRLGVDAMTLRQALGALPALKKLKVSDMPIFNDDVFHHINSLPPFPALEELILEYTPNVTIEGLESWLSWSLASDRLTRLSLNNTGVQPSDLSYLLTLTPFLSNLSISESVAQAFPAHLDIPPLVSDSLQTLHYEIVHPEHLPSGYTNPTTAYYTYLASSLLANGLPELRKLYVRDVNFPESLIVFAPPNPSFAADLPLPPFAPQFANSNTFNQRPSSSGSSHYGSPPKNLPFNIPMSQNRNPYGTSPSNPRGSYLSANPHSPSFQAQQFINSNPAPAGALFSHSARGSLRPSPRPSRPHSRSPSATRASPPRRLRHDLEVYTKGIEEMEWNFSRVSPSRQPGRKGSMTALRPVSAYLLDEDLGISTSGVSSNEWDVAMNGSRNSWLTEGGGAVRKSVIVGNGFGGFLKVPTDELGRPGSAGGMKEKRGSRYDIWR